jgi:hypothetical protein
MQLVFGHLPHRTVFVALFVSTDPCMAMCDDICSCNMDAIEANYTANRCRAQYLISISSAAGRPMLSLSSFWCEKGRLS